MPLIDKLFDLMVSQNASDLHLHEIQVPKLRVLGELFPVPSMLPIYYDEIRKMLMEICEPADWEKFEQTGDLDFAYAYNETARFRANYKKHYNGYGAVFRMIPSKIQTLKEIQAPAILSTFGMYASGLCLVTGPTGSGKTTTLAAIIDEINHTRKKTILTVEEPVEFVHPQIKSTIVQREVNHDCHSFGDALRGAMRQDIEVIMVGEMRDVQTTSLAVKAAEMGQLVLATLHTNSAIKAVDRIIDVFPADEQESVRDTLSVAMRAVCAQLLLRRADGHARVPVHEILIQTRASANLIREGKTNQLTQVIMSGRNAGMQLMDDGIERLLDIGMISSHEAYMKCTDKERFAAHAPPGLGAN
ncbi:MAG: PilT/PilU family type 4a pilus ATPase [Candidatus Sumerlaeaceae bacterium]|nr:PilT/PilU family type 4a pilus ATPase [Candidatus Sumerlaeaceae bacterium]